MKNIKKLLFVLVLLFAFVLVGCGGGGSETPDPDKPTKGDRTIEQVKTTVMTTLGDYGVGEHGSFVLTTKTGDKTSKIDMIYNYSGDEIITQQTILTSEKGTLSCYITDELAYVNQYDKAKRIIDVKADEGMDLIEKYSFNGFCEYPVLMLNNSFFVSSAIESQTANSVLTKLNIGTYDVSDEEENPVLTTIFDGIKEKDEVTVEFFFNEKVEGQAFDVLNRVLISITGAGVTSTIDLELRGLSQMDIDITFPDFTGYEK